MNKPHAIAVAADHQPIAVVLDLVHPPRPVARMLGFGREAGLDEARGAARCGTGTLEHDRKYRAGLRGIRVLGCNGDGGRI